MVREQSNRICPLLAWPALASRWAAAGRKCAVELATYAALAQSERLGQHPGGGQGPMHAGYTGFVGRSTAADHFLPVVEVHSGVRAAGGSTDREVAQ